MISSLVVAPVQSQEVDQPEGQTQAESHLIGDEVDGESSAHYPLIQRESSESFETVPEAIDSQLSTKNTGAVLSHSSAQQSNPSEPHTSHEGSGVQTAEQGTEAVRIESGRIVEDRDGHPVEYNDSSAGSSLSPHAPNIPQTILGQAGKMSLQAKPDGAADEALTTEERSVEPLTPLQPEGPLQGSKHHAALGANAEQSFSHGGQPDNGRSWQLSELWVDSHGSPTKDAEPLIQPSFIVDHPIAQASEAGSVAVGVTSQTISTQGTPAPPSSGTHVQPGVPGENMAQAAGIPVMKSVVVNIAQPDLGHVNIRVAMTNELVHTHLSSERLDVGQFLINSQDRLQTALQSSGLDLGQFRVDIDRHNGGRSFQQGPSQEQSQSWSQDSQGMGQDAHSDQYHPPRSTMQGLLNVVA
ncbi:MAG: flagellar hook-length control protein FliK [Nitrospira sp.]